MKKGSALLIVLGMLSFMVVSAVSFSILMRQNRLPSSYLRRNVASRYLVRAALARAIEELEGDFNENPDWGKYDMSEPDLELRFYGIYDDPYPGRGTDAQYDERRNGDLWFRRIFMPFGPTKYAECTVPTLTLEALAYLPPAIADDVRKFSRFTRTAAWRTLPYESGRYAYTAVNVSDLFDINRLCADEPRNSGADRISLLSLCSNAQDDPLDIDVGRAQNLHTLLAKWESSSYDTPFVSLADFNLLAGKGSNFAPFMDYVGKSSTTLLKQGNAESANALFITDTYFPAASVQTVSGGSGSSGGQSAASSVTYDLAGAHQPFRDFTARQFSQVLSMRNTQDGVDQIFEKNLGIGLVALYDYLDGDSKPISLALPTTEAVPMIAGVSCPAMLKPEVTESNEGAVDIKFPNPNYDPENPIMHPKEIVVKRTWRRLDITGFGNRVQVKTLLAYPFKRMKKTQRYNSQHKVRGLLRVFAAPAGMTCRPSDDNVNLFPEKDVCWKNGVVPKNGVATFMSDPENVTAFNKDVATADEAIDDSVVLRFGCNGIEMPVMYVVEEKCETADKPQGYQGDKTYLSLDGLKNMDATFRPLALTGAVDAGWNGLSAKPQFEGAKEQLNVVTDSLAGFDGTFKLYAALWLQVLDGSDGDAVVDMVPASIGDDIEWLGASAAARAANARLCGDGTPLLHFCANYDVKFAGSIKDDLKDEASYPDWKTLYAVDPRFNFAPEDWFMQNGDTTVSKATWKTAIGLDGASSPLLGQNGRDRDIFMFVSDQEYLQDIGELQFLPALETMNGNGSFLAGDYDPDFHGRAFTERTSPTTGTFANGDRFWRTYSAYNTDDISREAVNGDSAHPWDPIYSLPYNGKGVRFHSGVGGFKLNPYSDDARVIAAALAATPFDYYVASTNDQQRQAGAKGNQVIGSMNLSTFLSDFSFGDGTYAKFDGEDLLSVLDEFRESFAEVAKQGKRDWESAFNDLEWQRIASGQINDLNKDFMGVTLKNPLHQVDRKFLYSFWRECFDNRQQLFLIFVRAEPQSAAAGTIGRNLPSGQLGGRAVALVWRDPAVPTKTTGTQRKERSQLTSRSLAKENREDCAPHRTRVLFYHQFE